MSTIFPTVVKRPTSITIYRGETTDEIKRAIEYWRWTLAELDTDLGATSDPTDRAVLVSSIAFAEFHLDEGVSELERRQRLRSHPAAPAWPTTWTSALPDAQLVKDRLNLLDYYHWLGITPVRQGRGWVVPCDLPSHPGRDDNPSLRITESGRGWHCFVCNLGGDLLTLHCARTGREFVVALAELAAEAGLIAREEASRVG